MSKILIVNVPAYGHINPTLPLTKGLVEAGHEVTYLAGEDFKDAIEKTGAVFQGYDAEFKVMAIGTIIKKIYDIASELGKDFDVLIYESMFILGQALGEKLGIPTVRLFSTFAEKEEVLKNMFFTEKKLFSKIIQSKLTRGILSKIFFKGTGLKGKDIINEMCSEEVGLNITFTTKEFQIQNELFNDWKWQFVGPLVGERNDKCDIPFEDYKNKIIYISLGTVFNNSKEFFKMCIEALKDSDVTVIMSIGKKVKKEDLGDIPKNFYVAESVAQLEVLKRADLFITHGGMNSSNEAIYYGVPVIAFPQAADQPVVAKRMEELHFGKVLHKKDLNSENLKKYIKDVLSDKSYKDEIMKASEKIHNIDGVKKAVELIEEFTERVK